MMRSLHEWKEISLRLLRAFTFIAPEGFDHPKTRTHVRLLGPCFKTGRMKSYDRQRPKHNVCIHLRNERTRFTMHCTQFIAVNARPKAEKPALERERVLRRLCRLRAGTTLTITPIASDRPPFNESYRSAPTVVDAPRREVRKPALRDERARSIQIRDTPIRNVDILNLDGALLIPCASLLTVSRTF